MFNFFKIIPLKNSFQQKSGIIAYCSSSTHKVFCTVDDEVVVFLRDWDWITLHVKHLKFCCIPENSDCLYVLSQHPITRKIFLNVYNISTQIGRKNATLLSTSWCDSNSIATAFSAFYTSESQLCLAIGLESGNILFYKNILQRDILNSLKSLCVTTKPIKGIKFSKNEESVKMFVCSDAGIFCFTICSNLKILDTKLSLDDMDSSIHCIAFKPSCKLGGEQYLIVARENGLYCYTAEGRGPCYAINGNKHIVEWFGKYLIVLLKAKSLNSNENKSQVVVYDIDNKIIVLDKLLDEVVCLLPISGHTNCLIILKNGEMYTLKEKEMKYKLSCVIKKNLFDLGLKLLEESKVNLDISDVLIQYGDYVLQRGDSLRAITVFTKTIGSVPTFLIIKKLKEFRYNEVLIQYLSNLVQTEFKLPEHLDLLKNCVRRINLPKSTCRLFEINDANNQQQYIYFATINHNINVALVMDYLKQEESFSPYFFCEYSSAEVMKFFSECGYYLIKEYPNGFKKLTKYSLSDRNFADMFQQVLLPLSLINKLCAPYFIDDLLSRTENVSVHNILTELILQMWHKKHIDANFVIEFLKSNLQEIGTDNIIVLCRLYNFWPGIKMMYDRCNMDTLSNYCLTKCIDVLPEHVNVYSEEYNNNLNQLMLQTLTKQNHSNASTLKYFTGIAKTIISSNPYYILNMLSSFANSGDFLISHLEEFLVQDFFFTYFKCDELFKRVSCLEYRVICIEEVLANYLNRPIEFRNRSCDICKHVIKQPAIYFLCQHTFHRECWTQLNEHFECFVCADKQNSKETNSILLKRKMASQSVRNDMLVTISEKIGKITLKGNRHASILTTKNTNTSDKTTKKPEGGHHVKKNKLKNFTHNEYDDNLNPFMQK